MRNIDVGAKTFCGSPFEVIDPAKNGGKALLTQRHSESDFSQTSQVTGR
ncbi:MAG: hypothetical protein ACHRHE_23920 [Tepidisphaerales bacterium]